MNFWRKFTVGAQALVAMSMVAALVAACGAGGGGGGVTAGGVPVGGGGTTLTVTPMKGPFISGTIQVLDANLVLVGSGSINASGIASISVNTTSPIFPLTLQVMPGAHYWNELTGANEVIPVGSTMRSMIPDAHTVAANAVSGVAITPITELAVRHLENKAGGKFIRDVDGGTLGNWAVQVNASPTQFAQSSMAAANALENIFNVSSILRAPELPKKDIAGKFKLPDAGTPERRHGLTVAALVKQADDTRNTLVVPGVTAASSILEVHEATYGTDATTAVNLNAAEQTRLNTAWSAVTSGASSVLATPVAVSAPVLPATSVDVQVQTARTAIELMIASRAEFATDLAANNVRVFTGGTQPLPGWGGRIPTGESMSATFSAAGVGNIVRSMKVLIAKIWNAVNINAIPLDHVVAIGLAPSGWVDTATVPYDMDPNSDGTFQLVDPSWGGTFTYAVTASNISGQPMSSVVPAMDANGYAWQWDQLSGLAIPATSGVAPVPGAFPAGSWGYTLAAVGGTPVSGMTGVVQVPFSQDTYEIDLDSTNSSALINTAGSPVTSFNALASATINSPVCFSSWGALVPQATANPGALMTLGVYVQGAGACSVAGGAGAVPVGTVDVMPAKLVSGQTIYPLANNTFVPTLSSMQRFIASASGFDNALHVGWFNPKGSPLMLGVSNHMGVMTNKAAMDAVMTAAGLPLF